MNASRIGVMGAAVVFTILALAGCGSEEDRKPTDEVIEAAEADATEKGFTVTSSFAYADSTYDDYDDEDKGYVRLYVVFGTEGCVGILDYHEEGNKIVLEVERAVLGTDEETQVLIVFDPTAETLAQNAAFKDCFATS